MAGKGNQPGEDRPAPNGFETWNAYWTAQGMPWRTEPEIGEERQKHLAERRAIEPDIEKGVYPFRDEHGGITLDRADVEWLLASHQSRGMQGPVEPTNEVHLLRNGLDLRGANLKGQNLSGLPLARLCGGLDIGTIPDSRKHDYFGSVRDEAAIHLEGATLEDADLGGKTVSPSDVERVRVWVRNFRSSQPAADLREAFFDAATVLRAVHLGDGERGWVCLVDAHFGGVNLGVVDWKQVEMLGDEWAVRKPTESLKFMQPGIGQYQLRQAVQANRQLAVALRDQGLNEQADRYAYHAHVMQRLVLRRQTFARDGKNVGLGQRIRAFASYLGSGLLDLIAGSGYRPGRSILAYIVIICAFAGLYLLNSQLASPHLRWDEALVLSISSFHGRGFFTSGVSLGDTLARLAAGEAIVGLLLEITFIATFTNRFFAR